MHGGENRRGGQGEKTKQHYKEYKTQEYTQKINRHTPTPKPIKQQMFHPNQKRA
jgi:hypothetical protein